MEQIGRIFRTILWENSATVLTNRKKNENIFQLAFSTAIPKLTFLSYNKYTLIIYAILPWMVQKILPDREKVNLTVLYIL